MVGEHYRKTALHVKAFGVPRLLPLRLTAIQANFGPSSELHEQRERLFEPEWLAPQKLGFANYSLKIP